VTILFLVVGIIFVALGVAIMVTTNSIAESDIFRYDNKCDFNVDNCTITITLKENFKKPVYFYYHMSWFFQNYRTYVRSRSDAQLRGDDYKPSALSDCKPRLSLPKGSREPEDLFLPCGLEAGAFFNDSFRFFELRKNDDRGKEIDLDDDEIAWQSDLDYKFADPPKDQPGIREPNVSITDPHFVVWMRPAVFPYFRKLYGVIDQDLPKGDYEVLIKNHYPVDEFDGEKGIVIAETSWIGGPNQVLGISYLVIGGVCLLLSAYFLYFKLRKSRELADTSYLKWDR